MCTDSYQRGWAPRDDAEGHLNFSSDFEIFQGKLAKIPKNDKKCQNTTLQWNISKTNRHDSDKGHVCEDK